MDDGTFDDDIPDPSEPDAGFPGHDGPTEPLTAEERESVEADLEDLASMQDVFAPDPDAPAPATLDFDLTPSPGPDDRQA